MVYLLISWWIFPLVITRGYLYLTCLQNMWTATHPPDHPGTISGLSLHTFLAKHLISCELPHWSWSPVQFLRKLPSHGTKHSLTHVMVYHHFPAWSHMLGKQNTIFTWQILGNQSTIGLVSIAHPHLHSFRKRKLVYVPFFANSQRLAHC